MDGHFLIWGWMWVCSFTSTTMSPLPLPLPLPVWYGPAMPRTLALHRSMPRAERKLRTTVYGDRGCSFLRPSPITDSMQSLLRATSTCLVWHHHGETGEKMNDSTWVEEVIVGVTSSRWISCTMTLGENKVFIEKWKNEDVRIQYKSIRATTWAHVLNRWVPVP